MRALAVGKDAGTWWWGVVCTEKTIAKEISFFLNLKSKTAFKTPGNTINQLRVRVGTGKLDYEQFHNFKFPHKSKIVTQMMTNNGVGGSHGKP